MNGRALNVSDWRTQSVRDLFFYFLHVQEPLTKEQIANVLWLDIEDPQAIKKRFKHEIYWLRRAAGRNVIMLDGEHYRFNRDLDYEYDVEAFESYLKHAQQTQDVIERIGFYRKATELVEGSYLVELDADWMFLERERLGRIYRSALDELAHLYLDTNQIEDCLAICKIALEQDRFNELIYQVELRAFAAKGDRASAIRRFQEYRALLADELGLEPSKELQLTYRELIL